MLFKKFICVLFVSGAMQFQAQSLLLGDSSIFHKAYRSKFEMGAEYLVPTRFSNPIKTVSVNAFFWKKHFDKISVLVSAGLTGTYAWGYNAQVKAISDSLSELIYYKTSAFGLGPIIQVDPTFVRIKRFALMGEASFGVILYNHHFPYGGDIYNVMFRAGPSVTYQINNKYFLKMGYRWMHISNGQGYSNHNPFYEAQGVNISFIKVL